ncbi:MAG: adenosylcobinamide-GDP ribazoletransferase [Methanomassiliicoccales archaeon]|nr:adenosylcobinamide-GDP ribazoletransferase [Methanomassiliicoccales archaeon]
MTLFTIIPAKNDGKDVEDLSHHFYLILFVGVLYGLLVGGIMYLTTDWISRILAAAIAFASLHLLNRFLHIDGLSDFGDGMVCGGDAERKLAAMKDSKTGAGGVGYVIVFSLLSFAALSSTWGGLGLLLLPLVAEIMNKNAVVMCAYGGKAREGLGNLFVTNTTEKSAIISLLLSMLLSLGLMLSFNLFVDSWEIGRMIAVTVIAVLVSSLVGYGMSSLAEKNFGAVNGDVLGATNEICRPLVLIAMLVVLA